MNKSFSFSLNRLTAFESRNNLMSARLMNTARELGMTYKELAEASRNNLMSARLMNDVENNSAESG